MEIMLYCLGFRVPEYCSPPKRAWNFQQGHVTTSVLFKQVFVGFHVGLGEGRAEGLESSIYGHGFRDVGHFVVPAVRLLVLWSDVER